MGGGGPRHGRGSENARMEDGGWQGMWIENGNRAEDPSSQDPRSKPDPRMDVAATIDGWPGCESGSKLPHSIRFATPWPVVV